MLYHQNPTLNFLNKSKKVTAIVTLPQNAENSYKCIFLEKRKKNRTEENNLQFKGQQLLKQGLFWYKTAPRREPITQKQKSFEQQILAFPRATSL